MSEIYKKLPTDIQEIIDKQLLIERNYNNDLEVELLPTLLYNKIFNELQHRYKPQDNFHSEDFRLIKWFCYEVFETRKYGEWRNDLRAYIWNVPLGINENPLIFYILQYINNHYDITELELPENMEEAIRLSIDNWVYEEINDTEDMNNFCKKLDLNIWEMLELYTGDIECIYGPDCFKSVITHYLTVRINSIFNKSHRIRHMECLIY
jgi:hypothetical protein